MRSPLTVVLCTHRPLAPILCQTLDALAAQMPTQRSWRLVVVLNGPEAHQPIPPFSGPPLTILRRGEVGLTPARLAGFQVDALADFVLVDDDTILAPNYLATAEAILEQHDSLGAFGGRVHASLPGACPDWLKPSLGNLAVRDFGPSPIFVQKREFGPGLPIGAGMVVRGAVAQHFVHRMERADNRTRFGRTNRSLQGGEDSLLALGAIDLGLKCAYMPELALTHVIPPSRIARPYIARLNYALGRSHARVCAEIAWPLRRLNLARLLRRLWSMRRRLISESREGGTLLWWWEVGFAREAGCLWRDNLGEPT